MNDHDIHPVMDILVRQRRVRLPLKKTVTSWKEPVVGEVSKKRDPYKILVATILSLRTKDNTTRDASNRLFALAEKPEEMLKLGEDTIAKTIYPVGFYKNKAKSIIGITRTILGKYNGIVPDEIDELLKLNGVGRKTANLVITLGYNKPGICVDIHVHRISNRLGYVKTKRHDETEFSLRKKLPEKYWIRFNDLLVSFGQNICKPVSPLCSRCPLYDYCKRIGVDRFR